MASIQGEEGEWRHYGLLSPSSAHVCHKSTLSQDTPRFIYSNYTELFIGYFYRSVVLLFYPCTLGLPHFTSLYLMPEALWYFLLSLFEINQ